MRSLDRFVGKIIGLWLFLDSLRVRRFAAVPPAMNP